QNVPQLPCGKALYNYEGKEPGDLKFNKGDVIILHRKVDENWYHGELNGSHGFLPASYIQCIKPLSQPPPQGKALYDFEVKDKDQDKDCLTFTKDEILTVIRRVDDNWAEGMLGDKIGIFPILYVEFCRAKKALKMWNSRSPVPVRYSGESPCGTGGRDCRDKAPDTKGLRQESGKTPTCANSNSQSSKKFSSSCGEQGSPLLRNSQNVVIKAPLSNSSDCMCQLPVKVHISRSTLNIEHPPPPPFGSLERFYFCSAEDWQYQFGPHSPPPLSPQAQHAQPMAELTSSASEDSSSFAGTSAVTSVPPRVTGVSGDQGTASKVQLPLNIYVAMYAYKRSKEQYARKGYHNLSICCQREQEAFWIQIPMKTVFVSSFHAPCRRAPFAGGQPRTALPGTAQAIKVVPGSPQSAGPSSPVLLGSAARPGPAPAAPPTSPQLQPASLHLKNCLRISGQQTVSQARSALQLVHSPPAPGPERPTATVPPLRNQSSSSSSCRSQAAVTRPLSAASPQHAPPPATPLAGPGSPGARSAIPLTSAAAAITPPNVSATILNGEAAVGPLRSPSPAQPPGASACLPKPEEKKVEKDSGKEKKAGGLLKLLSGASAKKKSRSPPSVSPTHEPQTPAAAAAAEGPMQGATAANLPSGLSHGRAGSCPIESEMQGAMGMEPLHRKSGSLDLNFSVSPPARQPCSSLIAIRPEPKPLSRERYRVVVPYPPQSEAEIELKEGDIVFVHKKRDDGWFKGTLQRTGRTGLFPGSFVESF
uniref:RING-type E3 ubiquitin transferase n=1 Tax=Lepisosteus oculatus TaxID=7918 RepID=W5MW59_LEPOC